MRVHTRGILIVALTLTGGATAFTLWPTLHRTSSTGQGPPSKTMFAKGHAPAQARGEEAHEASMLALALEKKPNHVPVLFRLAKLASETGRPKDSAKYLEDIVRQEPANVEAKLELGKVLFSLGDIQAAIAQTEAILKLQPDQPDALYNLGAIYGNLGNKERALKYWKQLLSTSPTSESGIRARQMIDELK